MVVVTRIESRDMAQEKVAFKTSCLNIANKHKRGHFTEGTITYFKYALFIVFIWLLIIIQIFTSDLLPSRYVTLSCYIFISIMYSINSTPYDIPPSCNCPKNLNFFDIQKVGLIWYYLKSILGLCLNKSIHKHWQRNERMLHLWKKRIKKHKREVQ